VHTKAEQSMNKNNNNGGGGGDVDAVSSLSALINTITVTCETEFLVVSKKKNMTSDFD
jgi:hypothetical protein